MAEAEFRLYRYRWVVLAVFMFINMTIQVLWSSYASITGPAAEYYGVSDGAIGLLAMTFMIAFIPMSLPASWAIDTYGFRKAVSLGAILMGLFGITRGLAGDNYALVLISTIAIAIGQPFLLNAWTTVPAKWFSIESRATAVGLVTLANLVGTGLGLALTPILIETIPIPTVQLIYGALAAVSAVFFLVLARENPPTPSSPPGMEVRALMLDGLKHALKVRNFLLYLVIWFIGMGIFNGITTWVEVVVRPRGFMPAEAGTLGALMLAGGLLGAVIIPSISDKQHKRQRYLALGFGLAIPGLAGLAFANQYWALLLSSFTLGFFLVSASPVGMQYATEITVPTPEGTSNGLVQICGQASVIFVYIMIALQTDDGSLTPSLILAIGLMLLSLAIISQLKDPEPVSVPAAVENG
jgi:MFS family permease